MTKAITEDEIKSVKKLSLRTLWELRKEFEISDLEEYLTLRRKIQFYEILSSD